ncbi:uncharacterized protein LOC123272387 [Cotesia glomerata]|uniref:uncharacterized protein LOC123272387 n=1 Tax=Cotesia glomerata TaxID=32391 RepID=UPI001D02CEB0|nr:uncharacterized protein LOC123272387 [Cotesia glomerata]
MFDALNRHESKGVLPNNEDFKVIELSLQKLNDWEENFIKKEIPDTTFLTIPTAEGLRVTLQSSLDIVRLLTEKYGFPAVPTGRINQDSLEVRSILEQLIVHNNNWS